MKKIVSLIFVPALALLSSCGQSNEEQANKLFVEGAIKASAALKEGANYNAKEAVVLLEEAMANCDKILAEFPETNIAVSLVSGRDLNFGSLKYVDLPNKLEDMKNLLKHSSDFGAAGELLYYSSMDSVKEAFETLYDWREPIYKTSENKDIAGFYPKKFKQSEILKLPKAPEVKEEAQGEVVDVAMNDVLAVSKDIKFKVDLIPAQRSALEALLEMSENIAKKPNLLQLFVPYVAKMKENVARITLPEQREGAYLILSKILANMNRPEAASIALFNIKNEELQTQALVYYVNVLVELGNYKNAMELLVNIKNQSIKDDMAIDMAERLRQNFQMDLAVKVLDSCVDKERKSNALVEICAQIIANANLADISKFLDAKVGILSDTQLEILSKCLVAMDSEDFTKRSKEYKKAFILNELTALFAPYNNSYATKLSSLMLEQLGDISDRQERAIILKKSFDTAMLFVNMDASRLINSAETRSLLTEVEMQDIYLKYMVYHSLNGDEALAQFYLDLIDPKLASREKIIVAFLKANKTKAEILELIKR